MFNQPARRTVMVTGAAGNIGRVFCRATAGEYDLKCFVRPTDPELDELRKLGTVIEGDLSDLPGLKSAFDSVDTVIRLAGDPDPAAVWLNAIPSPKTAGL
jgi:nucleoside-diphosphate-sugar epimerase